MKTIDASSLRARILVRAIFGLSSDRLFYVVPQHSHDQATRVVSVTFQTMERMTHLATAQIIRTCGYRKGRERIVGHFVHLR
jgi:hypothetical protein